MAEIDKKRLREEMNTIQSRHPGWTYEMNTRPRLMITVNLTQLQPDVQREVVKEISGICGSYESAIKLAFQGLVHGSDATQVASTTKVVSAIPSVAPESPEDRIIGKAMNASTVPNLGNVHLPKKEQRPPESEGDSSFVDV